MGVLTRILGGIRRRGAAVMERGEDPLGRVVFGNLSRLTNNLEGRRKLRNARRRAPDAPTSECAKSVEALDREGRVAIDAKHDGETFARVVSAYARAIVDPKRYTLVESAAQKAKGIPSVCHALAQSELPELELLLTEPLKEFLRAFYGGKYVMRYVCARRTFHVDDSIASAYDVYSTNWHCDSEPCDRIKLFVLLSDTTVSHGPLHIVSRAGTRRLLRKGFRDRLDYGIDEREIIESKELLRMVGPPGTALFASVTQCLHRAGVPGSGLQRDIVEFQFGLD